jgi:hypothetical protein
MALVVLVIMDLDLLVDLPVATVQWGMGGIIIMEQGQLFPFFNQLLRIRPFLILIFDSRSLILISRVI